MKNRYWQVANVLLILVALIALLWARDLADGATTVSETAGGYPLVSASQEACYDCP